MANYDDNKLKTAAGAEIGIAASILGLVATGVAKGVKKLVQNSKIDKEVKIRENEIEILRSERRGSKRNAEAINNLLNEIAELLKQRK